MLQRTLYLLVGAIITILLFFATMTGTMYQGHSNRQNIPEELAHLTPQQYRVMYERKPEPAHSSDLINEDRPGIYVTADTGLAVFLSDAKVQADTGWPTFSEAIEENIVTRDINGLFSSRAEVISLDTGAYLGRICDQSTTSGSPHYCINGSALEFIPDEDQEFIISR